MLMYNRTPKSISRRKLEQIRAMNEQIIDLYPEEKKQEVSFNEQVYYAKKQNNQQKEDRRSFRENVLNALTSNAIYYSLVNPVLNEQMANTHERNVAKNMINNFITEHNVYNMISDWKHKSIYLAEMAFCIEDTYKSILESADEKIKEGLSDQDAYEIEDKDIDNFIYNIKDTIPKDITKLIADRVEDSVNDFVDSNKKNKYEIKKIYDAAKEKIDSLNNSEDDTSNYPSDDDDELQNSQENTVKEEYNYIIGRAKRKEQKLLETPTNVFDTMTRIILESVHSLDILKESYSNKYNKIDLGKVINDTKTMYTFLECLNTLNIVDMNEDSIQGILEDMKNSINK